VAVIVSVCGGSSTDMPIEAGKRLRLATVQIRVALHCCLAVFEALDDRELVNDSPVIMGVGLGGFHKQPLMGETSPNINPLHVDLDLILPDGYNSMPLPNPLWTRKPTR
jgi:hypothetical protein